MKFIAIPFLVAGAGLAAANPLHVMIASKDFSPMRLGHAAANAGPAAASGFSDGQPKPKMRHLCKNMQKAVQGTASRLLAFIGIGGPSLAVTAPVPEGGVTRIQITTNSPASHKFAPLPVVQTFAPVPGGPHAGGNRVTILPMPYPVYQAQDDRFSGPFVHRVHRALMTLGPWEGRIVAFVLGCGIGVLVRMFWVLSVLLVRALRSSPVPDTEETTIFVYAAEEVAPPYEVTDEKKASDVVPVVENRA
ncbi:hypothetical protein EDB85DRAFT_1969003 [Lactarius pseudohatsudake]|nr:hypothetical protein EDB85DRAFT_1969003 [Lactarius pseudohatsudake]